MFDVLLSIVIAFTITFLAIPVIITVAETKKLFDVPDERKIHITPVTPLGGLGIFAGFIFACLLTVHFETAFKFQYFIAASLIIFFLGLKDDILVISPIKKFIGQVLAAFMVIYYGELQIKSMHGFLGLYQMPEMFSLLLTYFAVIVIINSFNLIDGVDGLAGTLGLIALSIFGVYFFAVDMPAYSILAFSMAASLLAFLIFNFQPAKIFMGDTGSLLIGLVCAILVVKFINVATSTDVSYPVIAAPAIGFTILLIPLLDTLRVFGIRIFYRRSPFSPDRNHIHHILLDKGFSHRAVTAILVTANLFAIAMVYLGRTMFSCTALIFFAFAFFFAIISLFYYMPSRVPKLVVAKANKKETNGADLKSSKLVPFSKDASTILEQKN
jgi:UDP-GlcNAc:undecaprenyl-phosphate GlcNAc-1-phosphate transferase